jgi:acetyl esterase/lipase
MNQRTAAAKSRLIDVVSAIGWPRRVLVALTAVVAAVAVTAVLAGSIPSSIDPPPGAAPLRYRDEVFDNVSRANDLGYGSAPGLDGSPEALKLDIYQPDGDDATARPALVWVHGGGYSDGDKSEGPSAEMADAFARRGYVTVSINYRLLVPDGCDGNGTVPMECLTAAVAAIHDGQAAVRWLRANAGTYRIDPDRIGIGGESAGAITAVGVGIIADVPGDSGNPGYPSNVNGWVSISGGVPAGVFVTADDAPGFLFSGTADDVVPHEWSVQTADAMQSAGVPVYLNTLEGAGHVPWDKYRDLFETQSDNFFYKFLDVDHSAEPAAATAHPAVTPAVGALPAAGFGPRTGDALVLAATLLAVVGVAVLLAWSTRAAR